MNDNQLLDFKTWFKEGGDIGFNPGKNRQVIENSIKNYEKDRIRKSKLYDEQLGERASAVASYLNYCNSGGGQSIEKYFGRHELAKLRGEDIANQLKVDSILRG